MKIAYCGFDFFHTLLTELLRRNMHVLRVFTVEADCYNIYNDYIQETCKQANLPLCHAPIDTLHLADLADNGCELLISAAYPYKIPNTENFGIKAVNVHPSPLPIGRGRWPLPWIILKNFASSAVTLHRINDQFDAGDILLQKSFPIDADENLESLNAKVQLIAQKMLQEHLTDLPVLWENAQPQLGAGEYWPLPDRNTRTLDWSSTASTLSRQARAFGKMGCLAWLHKAWHIVYDIKCWIEPHTHTPGDVVHLTNTETIVSCADGFVCLRYFAKLTPNMHAYFFQQE